MIRVLLDQGIPRSTGIALREAKWDAVHVGDIGMSRASDLAILDFARLHDRTVITLDADFHALLAVSNHSAPSVIRIRREGLNGMAVASLLLEIWPRIASSLHQGAMVTVTEKAIRLRGLPLIPDDPGYD